MAKIKLVIADVDGTLTVNRGSVLIDVEAVEAIRMLERGGVRVALISGNSLPVLAGLASYLGASGPVAAENGCVGYANGEVHHLTSGRVPRELVEELRRHGFKESWQNAYRYHDAAFTFDDPDGLRRALELVSRYPGFKVLYSGYAIHVLPSDCDKGRGARWIAQATGVSLSEALAIGDGENDIDMLRLAGYSAAPGDADTKVKNVVKIVASKPGGRGFAEVAKRVLSGEL